MTRITFQDWIVELDRDRSAFFPPADPALDIDRAVETALARLPDEEREFVVRFYFMGESYRRLAEATGRPVCRFEAIHRRAFRRLRGLLGPFVLERFGLKEGESTCPLCLSTERRAIDRLLAGKTERLTWRPIIRQLQNHFGIRVTTPQMLISHVQFHAPVFD